MKNFRKCLKTQLNGCFSTHQHSKEFLCSFLLKSGITKNCFWWRVIVSCTVMLVVKFYESGKVLPSNFLEMSFFKHIETTASEITKKQSVIFNIVGTPPPPPRTAPLLKEAGKDLLKIGSPGRGSKSFARTGRQAWKGGVGVEMGGVDSFFYCFSSKKVVKRLINSNSENTD